jgi:hypothetical protein
VKRFNQRCWGIFGNPLVRHIAKSLGYPVAKQSCLIDNDCPVFVADFLTTLDHNCQQTHKQNGLHESLLCRGLSHHEIRNVGRPSGIAGELPDELNVSQ